MRIILAGIVFILTIIATFYIAIWWGIVEPILELGEAYDNETLSGGLVAVSLIKFLVKEIVAGIVAYFGFILATLILTKD